MSDPMVDRDIEGVESARLLDYLRVLYKRRWLVLAASVVVVVGTGLYTFTTVPVYQAKSRLLIEAERPNVVSFKEVIDQEPTTDDYYQTQYNILQSRALARRTLTELRLWDTPPFGGALLRSESVAHRILTAAFAAASVHRPNKAVQPPDETAAQTHAIDVFLANLIVAPIRSSRLVDVKFESSDPTVATRVVNTLVKAYIDQSLEYRFVASREASDWLTQRLTEQRQQVEDAEAKLQAYREQNDAVSLQERSNIVVQKLTELNAALTQAKTIRLQKAASYQQLESLLPNPAGLDSFPAILNNGFIQQQKAELAQLQSQAAQMGEKLGPNHPEMVKLRSAIAISQAKLDAEIGKVAQGLKNDYLAALANEESLATAVNAQKAAAQVMNRKAIDAGVLERDVQSSRQMYESLLQRAKETDLSAELKTSNIRIVDVAEHPLKPIRPQPLLNLVLALLTGPMLAGGLVALFEGLDNRLHTPADVRTYLKLPDLGMLPLVHRRGRTPRWPLVNTGVAPSFGEAFRTIRTNVLFASPHESTRSLVVTSTGPREGKSLVAGNLAISLAQSGERVLLVDADLRKPKAHDIFDIHQEPGLSNLLVGQSKASEVIGKTSVPGLWILPAGRIPPNPAELVGSDAFKSLVSSLNGHFDWIIVDSPPVLAVTDASLIAHITSGVLFVVSAEATSRYAARRALDQLRHPGVTLFGAVLNCVDLDRNPYYYSAYYRREYRDYYASEAV